MYIFTLKTSIRDQTHSCDWVNPAKHTYSRATPAILDQGGGCIWWITVHSLPPPRSALRGHLHRSLWDDRVCGLDDRVPLIDVRSPSAADILARKDAIHRHISDVSSFIRHRSIPRREIRGRRRLPYTVPVLLWLAKGDTGIVASYTTYWLWSSSSDSAQWCRRDLYTLPFVEYVRLSTT